MSRRIWPAVVLSGQADPAVLTRAVQRGTLVRLGRGVYSGLTNEPPEQVVRGRWTQLVAALFPGAVVVGASAEMLVAHLSDQQTLAPLPSQIRVLTVRHNRRSVVRLAGLEVRARPGVEKGPTHALPDGLCVEVDDRPDHDRPSQGSFDDSEPVGAFPLWPSRPVVRDVVDLSESAQKVGLALVREGPATRPLLGARLGLSKPTISTAIIELETAGLVLRRAERTPTAGRAASMYAVSPSAGWTLGIDVGNAQIRLAARALDGSALGEWGTSLQQTGTAERLVDAAAAAVATLRSEHHGAGPLGAVAVALPKPIRSDNRLTGREGPSLGGLAAEEVLSRLELPADVPVLAENNVNCAVLAELEHGAAAGRQDVIFLQVGERVGAGIVVGGRLVHGARGGAGEVADFPYPWGGATEPVELGLEQHLGAVALLNRHTPTVPPAGPPDVQGRLDALLSLAGTGDPAATAVIREHAHDVARLATALIAMLDPQLLILGGSIGENPLVARFIRGEVARTFPHTEVVPSQLRGAATVDGAATLAAQSLLGSLFPLALGGRHRGLRRPEQPRT